MFSLFTLLFLSYLQDRFFTENTFLTFPFSRVNRRISHKSKHNRFLFTNFQSHGGEPSYHRQSSIATDYKIKKEALSFPASSLYRMMKQICCWPVIASRMRGEGKGALIVKGNIDDCCLSATINLWCTHSRVMLTLVCGFSLNATFISFVTLG